MPTYLDDNGNPISGAPQKTYLDPNTGEPMAPAQPQATVQAAPAQGVTGYLQDVQNDLTEGGQRTIIGKGLGYLQGRGDKGYSGLQSGASPEQAQIMGSVPLGLTKMATGTAELPSKPLTGAGHIVGGALQAATLPASFVAPEAAEVAGQAGSAIAAKVVPSAIKAQAGGLLQSVAHDANKVPVQLESAGDAALKLMDWQKTTQLGPSVNKFLNRITNPKLGQITYGEARDFYQVLNRLSVEETNRLAPPVKYALQQMVAGLKQDIGNAADQVGRAADYYQGMGDYAKGAKLQGWYDTAKDALTKETIKGVVKGLGAGAGGALAYNLYKKFSD